MTTDYYLRATAELLEGWCGPVLEVLDLASWDVQPAMWDSRDGRSSVHGFGPDDAWWSLLLPLSRPEVRHRVLWWLGVQLLEHDLPSPPELLLCADGVWSLGASHPDGRRCPGEVLIYTFGSDDSDFQDPPVDEVIPALANIDPDDPQALAQALALVCEAKGMEVVRA